MNYRITKFINNPYRIFGKMASMGLLNWMGDKAYLQLMYLSRFGGGEASVTQ